MEENEHFQLLGIYDLIKSEAPGVNLRDGAKSAYIIKGRILHGIKDGDGETPNLDWFDWKPFDTGGFIKYEHDPFTIKKSHGTVEVTSRPTPANQIGVPLRRYRKGNEEFIEGALFEDNQMAKQVIELGKSIEEHNKRFPNAKRHLQFSIEGQYTRYDPKTKRYGGRVLNVVVSPQGVDSSTFATIEEHNKQVAKSLAATGLQAGHATSPETQVDGGALRKQSLEGALKNLTNMRDNTMDRFSSRNEAYQIYKSRGMKDEEAKEAVKKYFAGRDEDEKKDGAELEKCFQAKGEHLGKSIEGATALAALAESVEPENKKAGETLAKSVQALQKGEEIDGYGYLGENTGAINRLTDFITKGFSILAKSVQSMAEAQQDDIAIQVSQAKKIKELELDLEKSRAVQDKMVTAMALTQKGISVTDLGDVKTDAGNAAPVKKEGDELAKSVPVLWAENWLANKGSEFAQAKNDAKASAYFNAQNELAVSRNINVLSKSVIAEIVKDFQAQHGN